MERDRQAQNQDSVFVAGKEFKVDIDYLSSISPYIWNTLIGPMRNKNNEINGVDVKDFQLFLAIVNNEKCLKKFNINQALEICDFLMCDKALEICEKWIREKSRMVPKEKFALAVKYNLKEVKTTVLKALKTILDIEKILPDNNFETWDKPTTLMVLKWILSLFGIPRNLGVRSVGDVNREQEKLKIQLDALIKRKEEISSLVTVNRRRKNQQRTPMDDIFSIFHLDKLWKEDQDGWSETYSRDILEKTLALFGISWNIEVTQQSGLEKLKVQIHVLQKRMDHNMELLKKHSRAQVLWQKIKGLLENIEELDVMMEDEEEERLGFREFNEFLREMMVQRLEELSTELCAIENSLVD